MSTRLDPQSNVARISLESFTRALERNGAEIGTRAKEFGVDGAVTDKLKKVAFDVVFDSGELTIAGVREDGMITQGAAKTAKLLEALLSDWLVRGEVTRDSTFDQTPINTKELLRLIGEKEPHRLKGAYVAVMLLDPLQTGEIKYTDIKALRADIVKSQSDMHDPLAETAQLFRTFLNTASDGELARLMPQIRPGAQRFMQPYEPLA